MVFPQDLQSILDEGEWEHGHNFVKLGKSTYLDVTWDSSLRALGFMTLPDDWRPEQSFVGVKNIKTPMTERSKAKDFLQVPRVPRLGGVTPMLPEASKGDPDMMRREFLAAVMAFLAVTHDARNRQRHDQKVIEGGGEAESFYAEAEPVPVGKGMFKILGVVHSGQTYEEYKSRIEEAIKNAPFVMMEYFTPATQDLVPEILSRHGVLTREQLFQIEPFFSGIAALAAQQKPPKDIIIVNPHDTDGAEYGTLRKLFMDLEADAAENPNEALSYGLAGALLTRRSMMHKLTLPFAPLLAWLTAQAASGQVFRYDSRRVLGELNRIAEKYHEDPRALTSDDVRTAAYALPDLQRWRDLATVEGTRKTFELYADEVRGKQVPGFYGLAHMGGMVNELHKPSTLGSAAFPLRNLLGNKMIRRYRFDHETNRYKLVAPVTPY